MSAETRPAHETASKELDATAKAVAAWVNQLGRTLKTCRLYDGNNPTVIRFREELAYALGRLLDQNGAITLQFTADDVLFEGTSLHPARSRDDNLGLPFHRDGIRGMTFTPGIEPREVEALLDAVLQVSGQNVSQDDLVTLLWERSLEHLDVDYVPSAGDIGSGELQEEGGVPWPQGSEEPSEETAASTDTPQAPTAEGETPGTRSDDWTTGELTVEIEAGFAELDALAAAETGRFKREFEAEHEVSAITTALAIVRAALATQVTDEDRAEFSQFTPRLLRLSAAQGAWVEAMEALNLLRGDAALFGTLAQELLQPISISTMVEHLDHQESPAVLAFIEFAKSLGDLGIDLLNGVLAESQQRRNRRQLAEAIANLCRDNPERLAPHLSDRRWYVVRNIVHILGWIGGDQIVGMLRSALANPEPRVRYEVVAALGQVRPALARPVLFKLLDEAADSRMFCAVLHQLSAERNPASARRLLDYLQDPTFEQRTPEERRAIYSALSAVADDELVPELELELLKGNWFARGQETHRQSVARVLARMGTPLAKEVLQRGLLSKRGPVKKACEDALSGMGA